MVISDQLQRIERMSRTTLEDTEFRRLASFITSELGIKMPDVKKTMLQSRLQKRLNDLQKNSFKEYLDFVFSKEGRFEKIVMTDIITTNKTDFFRESVHFDYLTDNVLPDFAAFSRKPFMKVWSAGCSSGEEPYTLGIVLSEFKTRFPDFDFHIIGTDISSRVLNKAKDAVYSIDRVSCVNEDLKKKYLLKSKNDQNKTVKIVPELRAKISFGRLNFMDSEYPVKEMFDVIFCRNVLIYFDRQTQEDVINKLCTKLKPGGFFFLGHSESITNFKVPLKQIRSTIFVKQNQIEL